MFKNFSLDSSVDNNTNGRLYELFGTAYMMNTYYLCSRKKQNDHHYEKNNISINGTTSLRVLFKE